jgi:hypothetical protein
VTWAKERIVEEYQFPVSVLIWQARSVFVTRPSLNAAFLLMVPGTLHFFLPWSVSWMSIDKQAFLVALDILLLGLPVLNWPAEDWGIILHTCALRFIFSVYISLEASDTGKVWVLGRTLG